MLRSTANKFHLASASNLPVTDTRPAARAAGHRKVVMIVQEELVSVFTGSGVGRGTDARCCSALALSAMRPVAAAPAVDCLKLARSVLTPVYAGLGHLKPFLAVEFERGAGKQCAASRVTCRAIFQQSR